jgi:ribosomal protein S18 acetylase RimI-like enzyme
MDNASPLTTADWTDSAATSQRSPSPLSRRSLIAPIIQHDVRYFKRFRMEIDLVPPLPPVPSLASEFRWTPWSDDLLEAHARVKQQVFADEIDGLVFPNLVCKDGCIRLMREIRNRWGFRRDATWLIAHGDAFIATIQGVSERGGIGAIQNVGVIPEYRGRGLGRTLVLKALHAFRDAGLALGRLEVTADNAAAVGLYRRLGFRYRKTLFKICDPMALVPSGDWLI